MAPSYQYSVFGWTVASNLRIPDLAPSAAEAAADLRVRLGEMPDWVGKLDPDNLPIWHKATELTEDGRPYYLLRKVPAQPYFLLEYSDGHRFVFDAGATELWAEWPPDSTLEDNLCYLLGPIFGILLMLRGVVCLHASCVQLGGGCVALAGNAEAGKSTTAAAMALRGHPIVSDDITTLEESNGEILARPAFPRIRLWPASAPVLQLPLERLPALTPSWEKRYLDLRGERLSFAIRPMALRAIYVLEKRTADGDRPYLSPTSLREGLLALLANMYTAQLPDGGRSVREFPMLQKVVTRVPVVRMFPYSDCERLPRLCELIEEDVARRALVMP